MKLEESMNDSRMKEFYKRYFIARYDDEWYVKSIPAFKCKIEKNREFADARVKISETSFPFFHQVAQFELEKNVSSETLRQELIIAKQEWYLFPNGTRVSLVDTVSFK